MEVKRGNAEIAKRLLQHPSKEGELISGDGNGGKRTSWNILDEKPRYPVSLKRTVALKSQTGGLQKNIGENKAKLLRYQEQKSGFQNLGTKQWNPRKAVELLLI